MKPQYTTAARNVVFIDTHIHATFKGGKVYKGMLSGLREWAINNEADVPLTCYTALGRHGLYSCLIATDERIAAGLSVLVGAKIAVGDGATFASRTQMRSVARALGLAGIKLEFASYAWGITQEAFANDKAAKPTTQRQLTLTGGENTINDSPF